MSWSSSQNMLLICSRSSSASPAGSANSWNASLPAVTSRITRIQVVSPFSSSTAHAVVDSAVRALVSSINSAQTTPSNACDTPSDSSSQDFDVCQWSPDGNLLVARKTRCHFNTRHLSNLDVPESSSPSQKPGLFILDPRSLNCIYEAPGESRRSVLWAATPKRGSQLQSSVAYLRGPRLTVEFSRSFCPSRAQEDHWHVQEISLGMSPSQPRFSVFMSPSGRQLVAFNKKMQHCFHVYHHELAAYKEAALGNAASYQGSIDQCLNISWAPLPSMWPNIYATVESSSPEAQEADGKYCGGHHVPNLPAHVRMVDVTNNRTLGRWAVADLIQQASHGRADPTLQPVLDVSDPALEWAPDGRHLVVQAGQGRVLLLAFSQHAWGA